MERKRSRAQQQPSVRLSAEGQRLLTLLAESGGISEADVLETLIQDRARRNGMIAAPTSNGMASREGLSLAERLAAMAKQIPEEDRAGLPKDGAEQHDHYIYGTPKR